MTDAALSFPSARIDLAKREVQRADGTRERLTTLETAVLAYLAERAGNAVSREELLAEVWGYSPSTVSRACDNTMRRLRTKIEVDPSDPEIVITVHGGGYLLADKERPVAPTPIPPPDQPDRRIALGDRIVDLRRARLEGPDGIQSLTANEIAVLAQLVDAGGEPIDRDVLQRRIWGSGSGRPLESTISRLRRKVEPDPTRPRWLVTTAVGYRLELGAVVAPTGNRPEEPLPAEVDALIGRERLIAEVQARIEAGDRLVTLLGPGGVGKTRVALGAARGLGRSARWVDLVDAHTVDRMCATVARALRLHLDDPDPVARIGHALQASGPVVVVLDNLEQLLPAGAGAVAAWIERTDAVTFLVTSRAPLRIRGERRISVGALDPADAIALFEDRAVRPVVPSEREELAALVEELDRVPLAIELAAARTVVLSVGEIRRRTSDRLRLLAVSDPSRPSRHQSLRASLDASWALTGAPARAALAQLTVCRGGFTVEAAEDIVDLSEWPDAWPMDVVQELVDAHLVRAEDHRFVVPVIVQDYAALHLGPAERAAAELRHGRTYAELGSPELLALLDGHTAIEHRRGLAGELDNLLSAAERALARQDAPVALDAATAAWAVLELVGPYRLAVELVEPLLTLELGEEQRARAQLLAGRVEAASGNIGPAERALGEASRAAAALGSAQLGAQAHLELAALRLLRDEPDQAEADAHVALTLARSLGSPVLECRALVAIGSVLKRQYRIDDGRRVLEAAVALATTAGALRREAEARRELGELMDRAGEDGGMAQFERAARAARDLGDRRLEATVLARTGSSRLARGKSWAVEPLERAAALFRALGDRVSELDVLVRRCERLVFDRDYDPAELELQAALRAAESIGADAVRDAALAHLATVRIYTGRHEEGDAYLRRALIGARARNDRGLECQILAERGMLLDATGDHDGGRQAWEAAVELADQLGNPYGQALVMLWLGVQSERLERHEEAMSWFQRSLAVARTCRFQNLIVMNLNNLAEVQQGLGRVDVAGPLFAESLVLARTLDHPALLIEILFSQAEVAWATGRPEEARACLDEVDRIDHEFSPFLASRRDTLRARLSETPSDRRGF